MRVTFVLPHAGMAGGVRVLAIYAERLQRRGHQVTVVSTPLPRPRLRQRIYLALLKLWKSKIGLMQAPLEHPQMELSHFDNVRVPHRVVESARPIVNEDLPDADVVLATLWRTAPWVAGLSPSKGAKAIFLQGYETSPGQEDPDIDAAWRLPLRKIVISCWMVELARDRFGDSKVHHVPNSVDTTQFHAPPRGKQGVPTVGMLYAHPHLKGVDVSVAALTEVRRELKNLRVIAFGAEPVSPKVPLPDWVEFHLLPAQDEIPKLYAQCDVWLCGSRREGFHLPPLEAMACRCPVVSTRVGGPADIVEEGANGFLVDVEDASGLAKSLLKVLSLGEAEWKRMSDAALATATRYTWDDATDRLERALDEIVKESATDLSASEGGNTSATISARAD